LRRGLLRTLDAAANWHPVYRFIARRQDSVPVRLLCHVLRQVTAQAMNDLASAANEPPTVYAGTKPGWRLPSRRSSEHRRVYDARRLTAELHERATDRTDRTAKRWPG